MSLPQSAAAAELHTLVERLRADTRARGAIAASQTFRTLDGEVEVDWRDGDYLRVTFTGDAASRTHVMPPDWPDAL